VYHGLPDDLYRFHPEQGGYLAFLGRICPEKRVDRAIAIAQRAGIELKIAAKVDAARSPVTASRTMNRRTMGACWCSKQGVGADAIALAQRGHFG
jgi:hypothetical protein